MREGSFDEAFAIASQSFSALGAESVAISSSVGRITAEDLFSLCDLPAYATSSMDGWAVSGAAPWKKVGVVSTGKRSSYALKSGECMRIGTGGVIPEGCTSILPWEDAAESGDEVSGEALEGANFRPAALESKRGDLLIPAGEKLKPAMVGLLAATGHDQIRVRKLPRVAIFFLGDELLHEGVPFDGGIRDALGPQLPSLISSYGSEMVSSAFVLDDLDTLHGEVSGALANVDIIFTTGGTADGAQDFIRPLLERMKAKYLVDCVRMRPGYHILISEINVGDRKVALVALPGNPQSALAALTSLGRVVLFSIAGRNHERLKTVQLSEPIKTAANFSRLLPGNLDGNIFTSTQYLNSAMLRGVASADGFALVQPGEHAAGTDVRWISL